MQNKCILLVALGYEMYGNYAFNLALSIRKYNKEIPIYLMYENTAIIELTAKELSYFNGFIKAEKEMYSIDGINQYQYAKLHLFDIAEDIGVDEVMYIDVDSMLVTDIEHLFNEFKDKDFEIGCNGYYNDFNRSKENTYTFWNKKRTAVRDILIYHKINNILSQSISGLFYFKVNDKAKQIFDVAKEVYLDKNAPCMVWANGKPDEYCFNVALCKLDIIPPKRHYLFFEQAIGSYDLDYIKKHFYGYAVGGNKLSDRLESTYNNHINDLCLEFNIETRHYNKNKKDYIKERSDN